MPKKLIIEEKAVEIRKDGNQVEFIRETPAVKKIDSFQVSGAYHIKELQQYLKILRQQIIDKQPAIQGNVAFVLQSCNHAITIGYDKKRQCWMLIDANQLPVRMISSNEAMAKKILSAFSTNQTAIFSTELYVNQAEADKAVAYCQSCEDDLIWEKMHTVTAEKAILSDSHQHTWLEKAADFNQEQVVADLLKQKKGNTNAIASNRLGASLFNAAQLGYTLVVNKLLQRNDINVNAATPDTGATALYIAAKNNRLQVVERLLEKKQLNINASKKNGMTALYAAAEQGHSLMVEKLLAQADISVNAACYDGVTALWIASQNDNLDVVKKLLKQEQIAVNARDKNGVTPLLMAVYKGHADVVKHLLEHQQIAIDQADKTGVTPLQMAARKGRVDIVEMLLENKADINATANNGETALYMAITEGHEAIVNQLLAQKRIDVNKAKLSGSAPIHMALGNQKIMNLLLKHPDAKMGLTSHADTAVLLQIAKTYHREAHLREFFLKNNIKKYG